MLTKKNIKIIVALFLLLFSLFVVKPITTSPSNFLNKPIIQKLDHQKDNVMKLTAASTTASAAITLIPGDVGTPIAEKLADLSGYFLISLSAIYLEKYLLILTCYAVFSWLVPICCLLYVFSQYYTELNCMKFIKKIAIFSLVIILVVPTSVQVSNIIEQTYDISIETTIEKSEATTQEITNHEGDEQFLSSLWNKLNSAVAGSTSQISTILNEFIEAVAVLIVTSCIIPVIVIISLFWLIKSFFGAEWNLQKIKKLPIARKGE